MKTLRGFVLGLLIGAGGFWFFTDTELGRDLVAQAMTALKTNETAVGVATDAQAALQDAGETLRDAGASLREASDNARAVLLDAGAGAEQIRRDAAALIAQASANLPDLESLANTLSGWQTEIAALDAAMDTDPTIAALFKPADVAEMETTGFEAHDAFRRCPVIEVSNSGPYDDDLVLGDYTPWVSTPAGALIRAPVAAACLSSGYGSRTVNGEPRNHGGVDYYNREGGDIFAAGDGVVIQAGDDGAFGTSVRIDHGAGVIGLYAHMVPGSLKVSEGDEVKLGDVIGTMGNSGRAYAVHLHYELRFDDHLVDPLREGPRTSFGG